MDYLLIIFSSALSFLASLILIPLWIKKSKDMGLIWKDMQKNDKPEISGSGGIIVTFSFIVGVFILIAYRTFFLNTNLFLVEILAMLFVIFTLSVIGFIDDLFGWQKGGMRKRNRIILAALASIPLIVINAGRSDISIPFLGLIELGFFYPLLLIPLGIIGASTTYNFLAGFNGLEAGQGIILMVSLAIVSFLTGSPWLATVALIMAASLLGFMFYNFYPAKVFPGDSLTYAVGGLIAVIAILGNFEKIAVFFFIPYIIETGLKLRGGLVKQSFGKIKEDNTLDLKYSRVYGLTHLSILVLKKLGIRSTEKNAVYLIWAFQILIILLGFLIFGGNLV